jgi:flagellum-specific peptidoglycan hydrolase FlgJ
VTYDLRARPVVVLLLALAAACLALFVLERPGKSKDSSSSAQPAAKVSKADAASAKAAMQKAKAKAKPRTPKALQPVDRLPAPIRRGLAAGNVVVVALYDPRAKTEGTAMREARAGAEQAGSSFVRVDVRKDEVASLNALYGVQQDPSVLVLRPPGSLVVRLDGFADRETVAQAALNAAS